MEIKQKYLSFDGQEFDSKEDCLSHERRFAHLRLIGLTSDQIIAAINGEVSEISEAIEIVGSRLARARLTNGGKRRRRTVAQIEAEREGAI